MQYKKKIGNYHETQGLTYLSLFWNCIHTRCHEPFSLENCSVGLTSTTSSSFGLDTVLILAQPHKNFQEAGTELLWRRQERVFESEWLIFSLVVSNSESSCFYFFIIFRPLRHSDGWNKWWMIFFFRKVLFEI